MYVRVEARKRSEQCDTSCFLPSRRRGAKMGGNEGKVEGDGGWERRREGETEGGRDSSEGREEGKEREETDTI